MNNKPKNRYSMTFYKHNERVLFLEYVYKPDKAIMWVNDKRIEWTHCNLYDRITRAFIQRFYFIEK